MQKKKNGKPAPRSVASSHQVRIIGGQWKRTPLPVLDADGLRPTPDRVRETIFNWLNHLFDNDWDHVACLDLFAGSGALGFESASRGAERVVMIESNIKAVKQLQAVKEKLHAERVGILYGDAMAVAQGWQSTDNRDARFSLIFLDPPFRQEWLERIVPLCRRLLTDGGLVYAESEHSLAEGTLPEWMEGWEVVRADKAGTVFYHLLRRKMELENQA
jgi:16S rRNA (guanine966-N2)-methyltransferase